MKRMMEFVYEKVMRVLQIAAKPFCKKSTEKYEKRLQERNENKNFSLIVNTCIGGVIYHRLGMRFLSPTINLWLQLEDYVKLCLNLKHYMESDISFIETDRKYPVGQIDDITVYFEHYKTREEAANKWNERKKRINYDNLAAITILHKESEVAVVEPLLESKIFKYVKVLSVVPVRDKRIQYITPSKWGANKINLLDKNVAGIRKFEKEFDFVSFLNK